MLKQGEYLKSRQYVGKQKLLYSNRKKQVDGHFVCYCSGIRTIYKDGVLYFFYLSLERWFPLPFFRFE